MFTREELEDPRVRYLIAEGLKDAERVEDLKRRRERLERAACRARRDDDWERVNRYFGAADEITAVLRDEHDDDEEGVF